MSLETQLREHFREEYVTLTPSPWLASGARARGARLRRRNAAGATALGVAVVTLLAGGIVAAVRPQHTAAALQAVPSPKIVEVNPDNPIVVTAEQWQHGDFESIRNQMRPGVSAQITAAALRQGFEESGEGAFLGVTRAVTVGQQDQGTLTWAHRTAFLTIVRALGGISGVLIYDKPAGAPLRTAALPRDQSLLGSVVDDLEAGRYPDVEARFSGTLAAAVPTSTLADVWTQNKATFGSAEGFIAGSVSGPAAIPGGSELKGDILFTGGRLTETLETDGTGRLSGITLTLPTLR